MPACSAIGTATPSATVLLSAARTRRDRYHARRWGLVMNVYFLPKWIYVPAPGASFLRRDRNAMGKPLSGQPRSRRADVSRRPSGLHGRAGDFRTERRAIGVNAGFGFVVADNM